MAYIERTQNRQLHSVTLHDEANPRKRRQVASLVPLHYDEAGTYQRVDMTPERVAAGAWDAYPNFVGWRIVRNGFHYALGEAGQVGFGGKRGQHWVWFRLRHVGYLDDPADSPNLARDWYHLSAATPTPTYNTNNLSRTPITQTINGVTYTPRVLVEWRNLWTTPGGGELYLRFVIDGQRLKAEYVINEAGREWVIANRPPSHFGIPAATAFLSFAFQMDWAGVPRRVIEGVAKGADDDFTDADGAVELQDTLGEAFALFPVDYAYAGGATFPRQQVRLRKRFWRDADGNHYLVVGAPVQQLAGLPAGDLVFDPTITPAVGVSGDDGGWISGGVSFDSTNVISRLGDISGFGIDNWILIPGVTVDGDDTIDDAYLTLVPNANGSATTVNVNIYGVDQDNPSAPANETDANGRPLTSPVAWNNLPSWTAGNAVVTPSIATIVTTLKNRGGWASGNAMMFYLNNNGSSSSAFRDYATFDNATYAEPFLTVEYTLPAIEGALDETLGGLTAAGTGTVSITGTTSETLGALTVEADATVSVSGAVAATLGALTVDADATVAISGAADATLGTLTAEAAATVAIEGAASTTLGDLTVDGAGAVAITAATNATLGTLTVDADAEVAITGVLDETLGTLTLVATDSGSRSGVLDETLGTLSVDADATVAIAGAAAVTLGAVTIEADGTVSITGTTDATLGALSASGTGTVAITGTTNRTLGSLTVDAAAAVAITASLSVTLGTLTLDASDSEATISGRLSATISAAPPTMVFTVARPRITVTVRQPAITFTVED